jgi:hypothetical protein
VTRQIRRTACLLLLALMTFSLNGCGEPAPTPVAVTTPGQAPPDVKEQEKDMMKQAAKKNPRPKINP